MAQRRPNASNALAALDRAALLALHSVDGEAPSQLRALDALEALLAGCVHATPGGILAQEVRRALEERQAAFRAFHLERVQQALDARTLGGESRDAAALQILDHALEVIGRIDGESGTVRTLRSQHDNVTRGHPSSPQPFFARYLEQQKR